MLFKYRDFIHINIMHKKNINNYKLTTKYLKYIFTLPIKKCVESCNHLYFKIIVCTIIEPCQIKLIIAFTINMRMHIYILI